MNNPCTLAPATQVMEADSMLVRQKLTFEEAMCCGPSRFAVASTPTDWVHGDWDDDMMLHKAPKLMKMKEDSALWCRIFKQCAPFREFTMNVYASDANWGSTEPALFSFFHPACKLGIPICCVYMLCPPEIDTNDAQGNNVGKVIYDYRCMEALCYKKSWSVKNASGQTEFVIKSDQCFNSNMCAPSLCCKARTFDIMDSAESQKVGEISNIFSCKCKRLCFSGLDQYKIDYPATATTEQKAVLLSAVVLLDYNEFAVTEDTPAS